MARLKQRTKRSNGAAVTKGYCAVFYNPDRYPREKSVTLRTKSKRVAQRRLIELENEYADGRYDPWADAAPIRSMTLDQAMERYVEERQHTHRPKTIRADRVAICNLCNHTPAGITVRQVTPKHVGSLFDKLASEGRSSATRHTYYTRLQHFFSWCQKQGMIQDHPMADMKKPRLKKKVKTTLTKEQVGALIDTILADVADRPGIQKRKEVAWLAEVVELAAYTGMRLGEACAMRWSWMDLERAEIHIPITDYFEPKWGIERKVPMTPRLREMMLKLRDEQAPGTLNVFHSRRGREGDQEALDPEYVSKRFRHYRIKAGLPEGVHSHTLRHSFCTWMIQAEVPVPVVQRIAGHADIKTTMGYIHVNNNDLHKGVMKAFG